MTAHKSQSCNRSLQEVWVVHACAGHQLVLRSVQLVRNLCHLHFAAGEGASVGKAARRGGSSSEVRCSPEVRRLQQGVHGMNLRQHEWWIVE
jgi:hypothetical protein